MHLTTLTNRATFRIELSLNEAAPLEARRRRRGRKEPLIRMRRASGAARPSEISEAIQDLGWICALVTPIGKSGGPVLDLVEEPEGYEPRLVQARFESPLFMVAEVPLETVSTVGKILLLIYFSKRVWKLPIEFRTYDAEVRRRLTDAESRLLEAESRRDTAIYRNKDSLVKLKLESQISKKTFEIVEGDIEDDFNRIEADFQWPRGTITEIERRRQNRWRGESAVWTDESDDYSA